MTTSVSSIPQSEIDWWKQRLEELPLLHNLSTDFPRSSEINFEPETVSFDWSSSWEEIESFSNRWDVSPELVVFSAFVGLIHRYSGRPEVAVGIPALETAVGAPENLLPVRIDVSDQMNFRDLVERADRRIKDARAHRIPFEALAGELGREFRESYHPIVQIFFADAKAEDVSPEAAGVRALEEAEFFDWSLFFHAENGDLGGEFQYNGALFERASIERMLKHLEHFLSGAVAAPETPVTELQLPTEEERRTILEDWNDTEIDVDLEKSLPQRFEEQVDATPQRTAVIQPEGPNVSYRELDQRANRLARHLTQAGLEKGDIAVVSVDRSLKLVVSILAVLKTGAAYIPLNPSFPRERIEFILEEVSPEFAVTQTDFEDLYRDCPERICIDEERTQIESHSPERLDGVDIHADDLAYMVYTSGSTGRPKGVMIEHGNVANLAETLGPSFGVESDDRVSQFASNTFDATVWEFAMTLTQGAALVMLPPGRSPLGVELGRFLDAHQVTVAPIPPAVVPDIPLDLMESVETLIVAGEACPPEVVDKYAPGRRMINGYGPRETTAYATCGDCVPDGNAPPIGRPLGNYKTYVLDDNQQLVPVGVYGELYIGGPSVGRGYLDRPELNEEKFLPDPFQDEEGARMYRTGDLARWRSDGQLEFLGRRDFQVQLRGFRIELNAIENRLREHSNVQGAVAVKHEDDHGVERLVAYVVLESEEVPEDLEPILLEHLEDQFPKYMVPSKIVVLEEFPLNTTGKVDRQALPDPTFRDRDLDDLVEPRNELEETLAEVWKDTLGLEQVGVHEHFFDLGGTSLMVAGLAHRLKEALGVEIPMQLLYETPTIDGLADSVQRLESEDRQLSGLCYDPTLDIERESRLASDIRASEPPKSVTPDPDRVLLTGCTGFVGAYLLDELLEETSATIDCLVRADDAEHARERIRQTFDQYGLEPPEFDERVRAHAGDLTEAQLGLSDSVFEELSRDLDAIYHNGAKVDQVRGYRDMKGPNVGGTERMLRLAAAGRPTPFHYVSTTGSLYYPRFEREGVVPEEAQAGPLERLPNGYMQTKCVGEHLVHKAQERGIPSSIYRLGAVMGDSQTGTCIPDDYTYSFLRSAIELGYADDLNPNLMMVPVDFVAESVVGLSRWSDGINQNYHITHPDPSFSQDIIELLRDMGYEIERIPFEAYLDRLDEEVQKDGQTPILRFLPYLRQRRPGTGEYKAPSYYVPVEWSCTNLVEGLESQGIDHPDSIADLVEFYVDHLQEKDYL